MSLDKKKRAEKVRKAVINGAENLGSKDDYGHGLSNFHNSYKKINGTKGSVLEITFSKILIILFSAALVIFLIIYFRNISLNKNIEEGKYIPLETEEKISEKTEDTSKQYMDIEFNNFTKNVEFSEIETFIRLEKYRDAISKIEESIKKNSQLSWQEKDNLRLCQSILLYNLGNRTKARKIFSSLERRRNSPLTDKIEFYYKMINEK